MILITLRGREALSPIVFMKNISLSAFLFCVGQLAAQHETPRSFTWGAMSSFETQLLGIQSLDFNEPEQAQVSAERASRGGGVGLFARWQLWRGLAVQPELSVSTLRAKVRFQQEGSEYYRFTDVELPLHFVLTNQDGHFPLRGSLLLGGRVGWNFAAQPSDNLSLLHERLALDAGLGVEISLKNWRLQPELVYSHGLNNLHDVINAKYDWAVGRVVRDRLTVRVLVWRESK